MSGSMSMLHLCFFVLIGILTRTSHAVHDKCAACKAVAVSMLCRGAGDWAFQRNVFIFYFFQFYGSLFLGYMIESDIAFPQERPRNHLDMRHRLDSKGQREGKLIDYRVSELRVVELLDDLCEKMQDYTLKKDTSTYEWFKVDSFNNLTNKQEARAYSKDISSYCGRDTYGIKALPLSLQQVILKTYVLRMYTNHVCTMTRLLEDTEDELAELIKKGSVKVGGVSKVLCEDLSKHCSQTSVSHAAEADDDEHDEEL
ncbi:hypothetical protein ACSQ67_017927 [Phaseolus vulgaris]